MLIIGVQAGLN